MGTFGLIIVSLLELFAAILGTLYVVKYREDNPSRYFVMFLWLTVLVETIGVIPTVVYSVPSLDYLKDSFWSKKNLWLYNSYLIISIIFYVFYIKLNLKSDFFRKVLVYFILFYGTTSVINLIFSDVFFEVYSSYSFLIGSILIFLCIGLYFYEILQSNAILSFGKLIPFYFSVGTLVFHLCVTPLFIYSKYLSNSISPDFVSIYRLILTIANIFMYTCYSIGFIVCFKKNKSYS
ncbi:hypothetical protein D1816_00385 [Aquimarina sp. AD10]|nr:hypothetical protein D1816_00385 [Aquimarina sp. AD10]RKM99657.1 hypothetical protein D7033_10830 [Aquimarina sp. AD10]